jgi:hypothetical protein
MGGLADVIAAGLRSPNLQVENPMVAYQQYQQAQALKAEAAERQAATQTQDQQQQLTAIQIQEAQQAQQSQAALMRAYSEVYGGATAPQAALQGSLPGPAGAAPQAGPQVQPQGGALAPGIVGVPASALAPQGAPQGAPVGQLSPSQSDQVVSRALQYGATPQAIQNFQTGQLAYRKSLTETNEKDLELQDKHSAEALNIVAPLAKLPPDQLAKAWTPAMSVVLKRGDVNPDDLGKLGLDPNTPPDSQHLQFLVSVLNGHKNEIAQEQENRKIAAQETEAGAKQTEAQTGAAKQAAEQPGQAAQSDIAVSKANAIKMWQQNPQDLFSTVDNIFPPNVPGNAIRNGNYKSMLKFAVGQGDFDAVNKIMEKANDEAGDIAKQTNPLVQKGKIDVSAAEGRAHAAATIAAQQQQYAGTPMANVPPHLVQAAATDYKKATDAHDEAVQAADDLQTFTNLARQGNKVAYAYAPVEGVLTLNTGRGVKRVNMPEIESYGGAGSAMDRLKGWLGKQTSGASIPADVLNDMDTLHQAIRGNADNVYANKVDSTNKTFGSNFQPIVRPKTQQSGGGTKPTITTKAQHDALPSGTHYIGSDGNEYVKK